MMPYTALLACMSVHRRDASPCMHHPQTEHKQQHAHASCLAVLHKNRVGEKGSAPQRKAPSCDGAKRAAGLQARSLASCAGCMLFVRCINIHMLFPPPSFVPRLIFFVFPCLSLVSSLSLSHPLSFCNCQYLLSLSQSLSTFFPLLFLFSSYLFSLFPLLVSPISLSLISSFSPRAVRGSSGVFWIFHVF
jgi:hypothetical protein